MIYRGQPPNHPNSALCSKKNFIILLTFTQFSISSLTSQAHEVKKKQNIVFLVLKVTCTRLVFRFTQIKWRLRDCTSYSSLFSVRLVCTGWSQMKGMHTTHPLQWKHSVYKLVYVLGDKVNHFLHWKHYFELSFSHLLITVLFLKCYFNSFSTNPRSSSFSISPVKRSTTFPFFIPKTVGIPVTWATKQRRH